MLHRATVLVSGFLARLSVGRKLMLIYLLDLTAVIFVSAILISEKFIAIDFTRKEQAGTAYIEGVRDPLIDAARHGGVETLPRGTLRARAEAVEAAEAAHGRGLDTAELNAALAAALRSLDETAADTPGSNPVAGVLLRGRDLLTRVGNQSNLILDPDLDSYYTMSLVVLRYPELLEIVHDIGVRLRRREGSQGQPGAEERTAFLIAEGRLDAVANGIRSDHAEAVAAGGPALASVLSDGQGELTSAIDRFRQAARALMDEAPQPSTLALAREAQLALVGSLGARWAEAGGALEVLLERRVDNLYQRMWLHLGAALALLFGILTVVWFVARQIAQPLHMLAGVTDTVRRTGDHSLRAEWQSEDEIGRLVRGFNDMLEQLDHERELQKEMAASARAADAQRALVEATPIPLMVTSVPGHEVLHLNPPAEGWLGGRRQDPWKFGLESAVRARFFQQLADRGAVDEFEVRWTAGAEPAWAVLSARRVQYQGQDAVLTAFAPINHLKLMERRLELWAKVFEASGEGILIVDSERRILTANRAFSRATTYELQEVVGERPDRLFGPPAPGAPGFDAVWPAVAARGSWQGELTMRRRNGSEYPAWLIVNAVRHSGGHGGLGGAEAKVEVSHYIFTSIDISDRKKNEQRIRFLAEHDVLTELPNRSLCIERLRMAMQQAARSGRKVALLFIDLDRFKDINDSLGHHIGDELLRSVAARLVESVRAGDTVSRLGGDEFVVVLADVEDSDEAANIVEQRLIPLVREPHVLEGAELHVSCSVGIAMCPDDSNDLDTLMKQADVAMYQAKASGKNTSRFFTAEMTERAQARMQLESHLRRALELGQFRLHWQPRIEAATGRLAGVEGLLRWDNPELGLVPPANFIPVAEETGLIVPIGGWIIGEACRQIEAWRREGLPPLGVSINLSARQLRDSGLIETVRSSMARHAVPAGVLELEITESILMDGAEHNLRQLHALRELGLGLSIDDFGTGYSSLAYLNRFPIDKLKIDRSFVHDMLADPTDRAITMAIIGLGHTLGLKVVAEGVESEREAEMLRAAHCDELQGFLLGRPMPAEELSAWVAVRQVRAAESSHPPPPHGEAITRSRNPTAVG